MAKVSVTEAAKLAGVGRQQLYRGYISTGKISVERDHQGRPMIDTAEIIRVFGVLQATPDATQNVQEATVDKRPLNSGLQAYLETREEIIETLKEQLSEAKEREVWLRQQLERAQAVLTDQRAPSPRPWWRFWE